MGEAWASRQPVLVIATDVPTSVRRPGVWRGALHETTDQAAMFAPVVKEAIRVGSADEIGPALARAAAHRRWRPRGAPSTWRCPRTCSTAQAGVGRRGARPRLPRPLLDQAAAGRPRPCRGAPSARCIWAGGGARPVGRRARRWPRLAERLAAPVMLTYAARGLLPPGPPLPRDASRRTCPRRGRCGTRPTWCWPSGSDLDGMMTQGWAMPSPPRLVALNVDAADAAKNYPPDVVLEADAALALEALWPSACPSAGPRGARPAASAALGAAVRRRR